MGVMLFSAVSASAFEKPSQGAEFLLEGYGRNLAGLKTNNFGIPLVVASKELDDRVQVDVYGIFDHRFSAIAKVLSAPENWCDILALFPNVKACTYKELSGLSGVSLLTFYLGRMVYQSPLEARQVLFRYRTLEQQQNYLDILLNAEQGPFATKDHRIRCEAVPIDAERTFIHVSYSYRDSKALRFASKVYFSTLGRDKVGFTVTSKDANGDPVYLGGARGAVERNAVRCFFAIQSVMNSLRYPDERRFNSRINNWYDLTTRFRKQLFDLNKADYLSYKSKEHKNQLLLQQRIANGLL